MLLELKNLTKSFGTNQVLKGIDMKIEEGEFITLLGSSGCGKTTTLRIIAGLEEPDEGQVLLNGTDITALEPNHRDINTVFQNYALFPYMNVEKNISYGLRLKKVPKEEIKKRVEEMLSMVQLEGYGKRKPEELSGGQKQRVALARALASDPKILLLDEPLGALDALTRMEMQTLIERLWAEKGITALLVTHDVGEAVYLADRVILIEEGEITMDQPIELARPRERDQSFAYYEQKILDRVVHHKDEPQPDQYTI